MPMLLEKQGAFWKMCRQSSWVCCIFFIHGCSGKSSDPIAKNLLESGAQSGGASGAEGSAGGSDGGQAGEAGTAGGGGEGGDAGEAGQGGEAGSIGTGGGGQGGEEGDAGEGGDGGQAGAGGVDLGICGDGFRLLTEECDDGNASDEDACSSCSVLDFLAVSSSLVDPPPLGRRLGEGRHPLAADPQGLAVALVDVSGLAPAVQLARFAPGGSSLGGPVVVAEQLPLWDPHPVVAPLPQGHVVAWTAPDDDHLGVWMRRVPPGEAPLPDPVRVNLAQDFGQSDPDVLWDGQQLVVAWVDASDLDTGYDLHFRTFDANLSPTSGEQKLAATLDAEAHVALAPFQGSWAAAWRSLSGGLERIQVRAGASSWSVGPFLPGPASDRPSLAQLDPDHLLLVFSEGVTAEPENAPPSSRVVAAVLSLDATGELSPEQVTWVAPLAQGSEGLSQQQPHALRVGTELWLAWRSEARPGDALAEELWLKPLGWTLPEGTSSGGLELSAEELPLPRQAVHQPGDQRLPALAGFSLGDQPFLALAWEDLGRVFAPAGGDHEVVLQLAPLPLLRLEGSP